MSPQITIHTHILNNPSSRTTRPYPPYNSYRRPSYNSYGHGKVLPIIQQLWVPGYGPSHHTTAMGQGNSPTRHTTATRGHASVLSPTTNNHRYGTNHITVNNTQDASHATSYSKVMILTWFETVQIYFNISTSSSTHLYPTYTTCQALTKLL